MALQGQGLLVEESDLRRAENLGDMTRREPVRRREPVLQRDPKELRQKSLWF